MPDRRSDQLPLFALDHVLMPGLPLPLHVFEPRYRRLVADVTAGGTNGSFGVVLGSGSGPAVAEVGTVAEILACEPYPDGRCDLLTVGSRRFRILDLDSASRPYLCAAVEFLDEPVGAVGSVLLARTRRLARRYAEALPPSARSDRSLPADRQGESAVHTAGTHDAVRLSYETAGALQLDVEERQQLLAGATAADRLEAECRLLRRELAIFAHVMALPVPAPSLLVETSRN